MSGYLKSFVDYFLKFFIKNDPPRCLPPSVYATPLRPEGFDSSTNLSERTTYASGLKQLGASRDIPVSIARERKPFFAKDLPFEEYILTSPVGCDSSTNLREMTTIASGLKQLGAARDIPVSIARERKPFCAKDIPIEEYIIKGDAENNLEYDKRPAGCESGRNLRERTRNVSGLKKLDVDRGPFVAKDFPVEEYILKIDAKNILAWDKSDSETNLREKTTNASGPKQLDAIREPVLAKDLPVEEYIIKGDAENYIACDKIRQDCTCCLMQKYPSEYPPLSAEDGVRQDTLLNLRSPVVSGNQNPVWDASLQSPTSLCGLSRRNSSRIPVSRIGSPSVRLPSPDVIPHHEQLDHPHEQIDHHDEGEVPSFGSAVRSQLDAKLERHFRRMSSRRYCSNILDSSAHARWMRLAGVPHDQDGAVFKKCANGRVVLTVGEYKVALQHMCGEHGLDYWDVIHKMTDVSLENRR